MISHSRSPRRLLTKLAGVAARSENRLVSQALIRAFHRAYDIDMSVAERSDVAAYRSFNDFFTRELKADARPISDAALVSPVDGTVSQIGDIRDGTIVQAKNHRYTVDDLLAAGDGARFRGGKVANIYLSPRDYHRIHMPCDGMLVRTVFVPGHLNSVSPKTADSIPNLFATNERLVCFFDSPEIGAFCMVLVGATIVGSISTIWSGVINAAFNNAFHATDFARPVPIAKGSEMGLFQAGSTVILLTERGSKSLVETVGNEAKVKLGEAIFRQP